MWTLESDVGCSTSPGLEKIYIDYLYLKNTCALRKYVCICQITPDWHLSNIYPRLEHKRCDMKSSSGSQPQAWLIATTQCNLLSQVSNAYVCPKAFDLWSLNPVTSQSLSLYNLNVWASNSSSTLQDTAQLNLSPRGSSRKLHPGRQGCLHPDSSGSIPGLAAPLWPTLCDPTDCSPPGSSVHGLLQARTLE